VEQIGRLETEDFEAFVLEIRPRLWRALAASRGVNGADDAVAEALAYAWEHWDTIKQMENPAGYLYRVGQSRTRCSAQPQLPAAETVGLPDIEPRLIPALLTLPESQRTAVWLVHACGWRYAEVAEALSTSTSMVGNLLTRGLQRLRRDLEGDASD
jgi:DNA-directed RNA polymerase specialized sigma24 family protein